MSAKLLVYDIETDSLDVNTAQLKFFGAYSYDTDQYYIYDYTQKEEIKKLVEEHTHRIGFNNKAFDEPILKRFLGLQEDYAIVLDLYQVSAPRIKDHPIYGYNADRLKKMGVKVSNYKLNTIIEVLGLSETSKGDINYDIFKKDVWTSDELTEIRKYLEQDVRLTKLLYQWYWEQFEPFKSLLPENVIYKLKHISWGIPSLGYRVICHNIGVPYETNEDAMGAKQSYAGGHHIYDGQKNVLVTGNIVEIDFSSAYPHAIMMANICSPSDEGWHGDEYYTIAGTYNTAQLGEKESVLRDIYLKRMEAKDVGDKIKSQAYKIIINSAYGLLGNALYTHMHNPTGAADCTSIVRTWLKRLAAHLQVEGFEVLYGFTDSVFVKIPEGSTIDDLNSITDYFLEEAKSHLPFPMDTFKLDIEDEFKFFWLLKKNCYVGITKNNEMVYKSTLLNKNTPVAVMKIFDEYIKPKIITTLDVQFTKIELLDKLLEIFKDNIEMACIKHKVKPLEDYTCRTSIQAQISAKYGEGTYFMIPNTVGVGIGLAKGTKTRKGTRYCTVEEFVQYDLTTEDIDLTKYSKRLLQFVIQNKQEAKNETMPLL